MLIINIMRKYIIKLLIIKFKAFYLFFEMRVLKDQNYLISGESTLPCKGTEFGLSLRI